MTSVIWGNRDNLSSKWLWLEISEQSWIISCKKCLKRHFTMDWGGCTGRPLILRFSNDQWCIKIDRFHLLVPPQTNEGIQILWSFLKNFWESLEGSGCAQEPVISLTEHYSSKPPLILSCNLLLSRGYRAPQRRMTACAPEFLSDLPAALSHQNSESSPWRYRHILWGSVTSSWHRIPFPPFFISHLLHSSAAFWILATFLAFFFFTYPCKKHRNEHLWCTGPRIWHWGYSTELCRYSPKSHGVSIPTNTDECKQITSP